MILGHYDGPSKVLLDFMRSEKHLLLDWKGYRELTEK